MAVQVKSIVVDDVVFYHVILGGKATLFHELERESVPAQGSLPGYVQIKGFVFTNPAGCWGDFPVWSKNYMGKRIRVIARIPQGGVREVHLIKKKGLPMTATLVDGVWPFRFRTEAEADEVRKMLLRDKFAKERSRLNELFAATAL